MRVCLIPLKTEPRNPSTNLERLARHLAEIARHQPDLVCLPECTLTGYLYHEDDFRQFATSIPGPVTRQMGQMARTYATYLCFGLLEATPSGVYNSAVLLDRTGEIILTHRKIQETPPFACGDAVDSVATELGRLGILICGDLFNDDVTRRLAPSLDVLIAPMSRSFDKRSPDGDRWVSEERQAYLEAIKAIGTATLITNAFEINTDAPSFGGAMVVSATGELLAESPHGTDSILTWEPDRKGG
jgi:predicted amidohydrolase